LEAFSRESANISPLNWLAVAAAHPALKEIQMANYSQTGIHLARTACALEQFRRARGNYPNSLAELSPQYLDPLPVDIVNGRLLKYRRDDQGRYLIYSVGWDLKDDGGKPALSLNRWGDGDWGWRYPKTARATTP
jgi:hypothetical protein